MKYDLLVYFRDNVIANSGTVGDWVDLSMLPAALGDDLTERLLMFAAYKKNGLAIIDSSLEGRAFNNNTTIAGFDDTLKAQTVQAFNLALQQIEETCSSITGVYRERLGGIQLRDAVTNVQTSMNNSYIITKHYYMLMDNLVANILIDALNTAKVVWKNGITGVLILGDKYLKIFTALPEHYTLTDYDIHIVSSSLIMQEIQTVKLLSLELIKNGVAADIAMDAATSHSLTEMTRKVTEGITKAKEESATIEKAQQLILELQQLLQQTLQQLKQALDKVQQYDQQRLQIEQQRINTEAKIEWFKAKTDRDFKANQAENDTKRTTIEYQQQFDGNPYNDAIRNV